MGSSKTGDVHIVACSRIGKNGRVTIPGAIRRKMRLRAGDELLFAYVEGHVVLIRKRARLDIPFLRVLEATLSEWNSTDDDCAFHDL